MNCVKRETELIVALDFEKLQGALDFVETAGDSVTWYKIGSQLFCSAGPAAARTRWLAAAMDHPGACTAARLVAGAGHYGRSNNATHSM